MGASEKPNDDSGREPEGGEATQPYWKIPGRKHPTPLFLRDSSEGQKGDQQDEKDETAE